ncbi:PH domain-containing protein [Kribbella sp. CA-293567]|uniref:PH domain-containing protein n=1 Tax=Kribbella sp. CA-293567 TaxID=3002436 RepID=UPI0022DCF3ED|nr:PH domain-containing protein [Kribbella sp. CA-293567]WBQ07287.1 PH domain-containing protein [Kribbella sp. CA-293567]
MTSTALWSFRPWAIAMMAGAMGLSIVAVFGVVWFQLSDDARDTFTLFQRITLLAFFGTVLYLLYRMATVRVTAYEDSLQVRNVFRTYKFEWSDVKGLRFRSGDPWLQLFDAEGNRFGVLAVQASEGARAGKAAKELATVARSHGAGQTETP